MPEYECWLPCWNIPRRGLESRGIWKSLGEQNVSWGSQWVNARTDESWVKLDAANHHITGAVGWWGNTDTGSMKISCGDRSALMRTLRPLSLAAATVAWTYFCFSTFLVQISSFCYYSFALGRRDFIFKVRESLFSLTNASLFVVWRLAMMINSFVCQENCTAVFRSLWKQTYQPAST